MASVAALGWLALATSVASAWPVLSEGEQVAGLRCYPDHESASLWWYLPDRLEMIQTGGKPSFRFERYRYTGTTATGDQGTFWGKGILTLGVRFAVNPDTVSGARTALSSRYRRNIALQHVPVERVESKLLFASARPEGPSGDLGNGDWGGGDANWQERTFGVGLSPETTQLLWGIFHDEGLAMSLAYSLVGKAVPHRPTRDPVTGKIEDIAVESSVLTGSALPIRVSPESCRDCFASTELDAQIPAEYPFLETRCYDFAGGLAPMDLGLVIVEVRATAVTGDTVEESVRFAPGGATVGPIHFRVAVSLEAGYEYRVVRVFDDGHVEAEPWVSARAFSGMVDVTGYRREIGERMDARDLY